MVWNDRWAAVLASRCCRKAIAHWNAAQPPWLKPTRGRTSGIQQWPHGRQNRLRPGLVTGRTGIEAVYERQESCDRFVLSRARASFARDGKVVTEPYRGVAAGSRQPPPRSEAVQSLAAAGAQTESGSDKELAMGFGLTLNSLCDPPQAQQLHSPAQPPRGIPVGARAQAVNTDMREIRACTQPSQLDLW